MTTTWILGSMGWMPARKQQTACVLVELEGELILLDAGTGVANLGLCADVLARHEHLCVLLSHYHLDHVVGLMYLKRFVANKRVDVYGPGTYAYPRSTADYMADVLQPTVYASGHMGFARDVRYHDFAGSRFSVGDVQVEVRSQRHSSPSFELRLNDDVVYATDTSFAAEDWQGVRPAKLLLHECWQAESRDPRHSDVRSLASGVPNAFGRVVLLHQNPAWEDAERAEVEQLALSRGFELAYDGMAIEG
ncbi:MAG: MBL fold metallo-hydrolase [Atopobiaceae bacterium]|nr:MBL fold metallo-hydrolase [Atopobiaceae bacterium]